MRWFSCLPLFLKKKLIKRSSVFIPNQDFTFPWPIVRYICSNGHSRIQLKLFSTCQQLKNTVAEIRDYQIDKLEYSTKIRTHFWSMTNQNEIFLRWSSDESWTKIMPQKPKIKFLEVDDFVIGNNTEKLTLFFKNLDFSILESVELMCYPGDLNVQFDVFGDLQPMFGKSLAEITLNTYLKLGNGDLLTMALTELPNLKILEMRWQPGITNLSTAALIPRLKKLQRLKLAMITVLLTPQIISNFIIHQMSDPSETEFYMGYYESAENACECFQKEINDIIQEKFEGAKFILNVLYTCSH